MKNFSLTIAICWATLTAFWVKPTADTPGAGAREQIWQSFRQRFPFHIQTIGKSKRQADGSYVLLVSEPPPHVTTESIKALYKGRDVLVVEEKSNQLGFDGWAKDLLIEVKKSSAVEMDTFYNRLYRHLFFTAPSSHDTALDLSVPKESVFFSNQKLNYEVSNADLDNWLLSDNALGFVPLNKREAAVQTLAQVLEKKQTGVWSTQKPILIAWVLPLRANLSGKEAEIRTFATHIDFILGAVRLGDCVAIIAHKRTVPETVLPTMRTETILALAAAPPSGLGQSYERNFVLAGRIENDLDGAPIYLSTTLQNTDFGSLLNIADQMLKSWSLNGMVKYTNFTHPKPLTWAFPGPLNTVLGVSSMTFNANMVGATQTFEFPNHPKFRNLSITNVSRTGAMAISYLPQGIHPDSIRPYEEIAWKYFSGLGSPIWAQTLRYGALFQFFKNFEIKADSPVEGRNTPLDVSHLTKETLHLLAVLDSLDQKGVQDLALKCVLQTPTLSKDQTYSKVVYRERDSLIHQLTRCKSRIDQIKKQRGVEGLKKWADLMGNPWALNENPISPINQEVEVFAEEIDQLKSIPMLFELLGIHLLQILKKYSQQNEAISNAWLKTPLVVTSHCTSSISSWSGGHNIGASGRSFRVGQASQIAEFLFSDYDPNEVKVMIDKSVFAQLTPEVMRRLEFLRIKAMRSDDLESIEKEMRAILLATPAIASRSCEIALPLGRWQ